MARLRLKFGRNPYTTELICGHCRRRFTGGGKEDLPPEIRGPCAPSGEAPPALARGEPTSATPPLEQAEREIVLRALEEAGGNKVRAARLLGIKWKRLYRLLHKHDLMPSRQGQPARATGSG